MNSPFDTLPIELCLDIMSYLDLIAIGRFGACCKSHISPYNLYWHYTPKSLIRFVDVIKNRHSLEQNIWRATNGDFAGGIYKFVNDGKEFTYKWPPNVDYSKGTYTFEQWRDECLTIQTLTKIDYAKYMSLDIPITIKNIICIWLRYPLQLVRLIPYNVLKCNYEAALKHSPNDIWVPLFEQVSIPCLEYEMSNKTNIWNFDDTICNRNQDIFACRICNDNDYYDQRNFVFLYTDFGDSYAEAKFFHRDNQSRRCYYIDPKWWSKDHVSIIRIKDDDVFLCSSESLCMIYLPHSLMKMFNVYTVGLLDHIN